jgi:hypothetical protein
MTGVKHIGFAPVFYFHEIHKSISKLDINSNRARHIMTECEKIRNAGSDIYPE